MMVWNEVRVIGLMHHERTAMDYYAGVDVSSEKSSVCVVDAKGKVGREVKIASEPGCLIGYFGEMYLPVFVSAWRQPPFPRGCTGNDSAPPARSRCGCPVPATAAVRLLEHFPSRWYRLLAREMRKTKDR